MKVIVIGLGSMGKRRIRLLKKHFPDINIVGVDKKIDRREAVERLFKINVYGTMEEAFEKHKFKAAIICTPPLTHYTIIKKCLLNKMNVFTEINLSNDGYDEIIEIAQKNNLYVFLSSTMMYRKEIEYLDKIIKNNAGKVNYRYHVGQYLPDWHPWENYKDFFVKDKRSNGCRELLAIELPWIINSFGKVKEMYVIKDKISNLDLDYPDTYNILIRHINGNIGNLNIDIVSRKATRCLEVYSEKIHFFWDGKPTGLKEYDIKNKKIKSISIYNKFEHDSSYADNIIEDAYLEELKLFINNIIDKNKYRIREKYSLIDDLYTLTIIDQIEGYNV